MDISNYKLITALKSITVIDYFLEHWVQYRDNWYFYRLRD